MKCNITNDVPDVVSEIDDDDVTDKKMKRISEENLNSMSQ